MTDSISSKCRSEIISHIKSKDTSIELMVRRRLFAIGYLYQANYKALPGKPDILFTKKKIAIFIHGCYWPRHDCGSRYAHISQSNKSSAQSNGIGSIFMHWRQAGGRLLCCGSAKLKLILKIRFLCFLKT